MARKIRIHERNGRYFLKTRFNDKDYTLTYGTAGNMADLAYMQMVCSIALERINKGTFSGFDDWKINKFTPIGKVEIIDALREKDSEVARAIIKKLCEYKKPVNNATHLSSFFSWLEVSSSSKNRYLSEFKRIVPSFCEGLSFSKSKGEPDPFSESEVKKILSWMKDNKPIQYPLFAFWFDTGLRNGELRALTDEDFNDEVTRVRVSKSKERDGNVKGTKNGKVRNVPLGIISRTALSSLATLISPGEPLFPQLNSESNLVKRVWKPCLKALGIRYRKLYCIRHTAISRKCKEYQGDLARVARESGNTPEVISKHYLGVYE